METANRIQLTSSRQDDSLFRVNHKRIQWVARDEGLRVLRTPRKRYGVGVSLCPPPGPEGCGRPPVATRTAVIRALTHRVTIEDRKRCTRRFAPLSSWFVSWTEWWSHRGIVRTPWRWSKGCRSCSPLQIPFFAPAKEAVRFVGVATDRSGPSCRARYKREFTRARDARAGSGRPLPHWSVPDAPGGPDEILDNRRLIHDIMTVTLFF